MITDTKVIDPRVRGFYAKAEDHIFLHKKLNDPTWYASLRGVSGSVNSIICST